MERWSITKQRAYLTQPSAASSKGAPTMEAPVTKVIEYYRYRPFLALWFGPSGRPRTFAISLSGALMFLGPGEKMGAISQHVSFLALSLPGRPSSQRCEELSTIFT